MNDYPKISNGIMGNDNIEKTNTELFLNIVRQYFPETIKDGKIDFNALKEEMGEFKEINSEHYNFTWSGKQAAKKEAQTDIFGKTLKFKPKDSLNVNTTENIYIEGDNLEALKLIRRNYYGKIKMIYIDPPYNTGSDFIYHDNFIMKENEIAELSGDIVNGERLQKNSKDGAKYHTNWLNMMYPRLKIAKDLLSDDGVIFISIDDNEQENLKKICDEIFGTKNYLSYIVISTGASQNGDGVIIQKNYELCLSYAKSINNVSINRVNKAEENLRNLSDAPTPLITRPDMGYTIYYNPKTKDIIPMKDYDKDKIILNDEKQVYTDNQNLIKTGYIAIRPGIRNGQLHRWRWGFETFCERKNEIVIKSKKSLYSVYFKQSGLNPPKNVWNYTVGTNELKNLFDGKKFFDFPKNTNMIKYIASISTNPNSIILDFFSGSATTAHAIMQLNAEDGGQRKFIMVQIPELCDKKSEAYNSNFKNICEIGKERIRRAAKKIHEENPKAIFDDGFKVFEISDTNIRWNKMNDEDLLNMKWILKDKDKLDFNDGYTDIDIVYEIMLRQYGIPLSATIKNLTDISNRTYIFDYKFVVCLENKITDELIKKLANIEPLPMKYILRDSAFDDDIEFKDISYRKLSALIENDKINKKERHKYNNFTVEFI